MINLKNVTTYGLLRKIKNYSENTDIFDLLIQYSVHDYQKLKDLVDIGNPNFNVEYLKQELLIMEQNLKQANINNYQIPVYLTNGYNELDIDLDVLLKTEQETLCSDLIKNPTRTFSVRDNAIAPFNIFLVKHLLSHVVVSSRKEYNRNALIHYVGKYGDKEAIRIKNSINIYEEQIIRQVMDSNVKTGNLFMIDKTAKEQIVKHQFNEIVEYLTDTSSLYIWGKLSDVQKKQLISSIYGKYKNDIIIRNNLINIISNYTTLKELESNIIKTKTIDRFIVK